MKSQKTSFIKMKTIALVLLIAGTASAIDWSALHVKWNSWLLDYWRTNSMFEIPLTLSDVDSNWESVDGINTLGLTTYCYPNDGQFCVLYDGYGSISGFQAGILVSDTAGASAVYDPSSFDVYQTKTIFGQEYYTSTVYTVNPETLVAGGRSDMNDVVGEEGVWFEKSDGTYQEIPRNVEDFDSLWIEEACISEMGTHYYYDMSTSTDCAKFFPWFLLVKDGELSGLGIQAFGSCTIQDRSWCEWVPAAAITPTIPTTPDCLVDWAGTYGVISIHFYFTADPWDITCS